MSEDELVAMGFVRGAFGIRGWVKVHTDTEFADGLFDYPTWWLKQPDGTWKPYTLLEGAVHTKDIAAQLEGIDDRDKAAALRGCTIAVPRSSLPVLAEGEYYWSDLVGLNVVNPEGDVFGKVTELLPNGTANEVLVVHDGTQERLIPYVAAYVLEVDVPNQRMVVAWGLDY